MTWLDRTIRRITSWWAMKHGINPIAKAIPELNRINAEIEVIKRKHGKGGKALAKKRERIVTEALRGKA